MAQLSSRVYDEYSFLYFGNNNNENKAWHLNNIHCHRTKALTIPTCEKSFSVHVHHTSLKFFTNVMSNNVSSSFVPLVLALHIQCVPTFAVPAGRSVPNINLVSAPI